MKAIVLSGLLILPFIPAASAFAATPVYNSKANTPAVSPASNCPGGSCSGSASADNQSQPMAGSQCSKCSG